MKKKILITILLTLGIILLIVPIVLVINETAKLDIIGGSFAMLPYRFFYSHKGIYSSISFLGVACIITSIVLAVFKRKKQ